MAAHAFTLLLLLCAVALVAAQQDAAGAGQGFNGGNDTPARPGANGGGRPPFQGETEGLGLIISILILISILGSGETAVETDLFALTRAIILTNATGGFQQENRHFFLFSPLK